MKDLECALLKVKENPEKYIGKVSIHRLRLFVLGYTLSQADENGTYSDWLKGFPEFVAEKYKITLSQNWSEIIRFHSVSDDHAFDVFYELLDEYYRKE